MIGRDGVGEMKEAVIFSFVWSQWRFQKEKKKISKGKVRDRVLKSSVSAEIMTLKPREKSK